MIQLAIIHSQPIYSQALAKLIATNEQVKVVAIVQHLRQLIGTTIQSPIDIIIWHIPSHHALPPGLRVLKERFPLAKVIALIDAENSLYSGLLINLGADITISTSSKPISLFQAILNVHHQYTPPPSSNHVEDPKSKLDSPERAFSTRELDVLQLICEGLTDQQIAIKLGLSKRTIDGYRFRLRKKLLVPNTALLVRKAIEHELIPLTIHQ